MSNRTTANPSNGAASTAATAPGNTPSKNGETLETPKYTEAQYQEQRAKIQSEYQKQVNTLNLKVTTLESALSTEKSQAEILRAELGEAYTDESVKIAATKVREATLSLKRKEIEVDGLKSKLWKEDHDRYADTLTERFGIGLDEQGKTDLKSKLMALESQDDMNNFIVQNNTPVVSTAPATSAPPATVRPTLPAPPNPTAGLPGADLSRMTPKEKIKFALEQEKLGG